MNKKFLSAVLFGALMVASTGTFVSCKDYDDDIENLQGQIDKNAKAIEEINALIAKGSVITSVTPNGSGIDIVLSNGDKHTITNGAKGENGKDADVWTIGEDGYWRKNDVKQDWKAVGTDGEQGPAGPAGPAGPGGNGKDGCYYKPNVETGYFDLCYADGTVKETTTIEWRGTGVTAVETEYEVLISGVQKADGTMGSFSISKSSNLRALVFQPELYYQGIEAINVKSFKYNALAASAVNADKDNSKDAPTAATALTEVAPEMFATYHMNPANADVRNLTKEDLKFLAYDKTYARAASTVVVPTVTDMEAKDGKLTVWAKLTDGTIKDIDTDELVTVLALQANYTDGNGRKADVTSDYAAVKATTIESFALNNAKVAGESHLATTAAEAIAADAAVNVSWDETVDLAEYVQTHYGKEGAHKAWDKNAASGEVEKSNFSYTYELVGYFEGVNKTSQSAHAALNGSVLRPQLPKDGKAAAWGETAQSQAVIGRMPLVRVFLVDNNGAAAQKVAVGYLKIEITGAPADDRIAAKTTYTFHDEYTLNCGTADLVQNVTWFQIEEQILAQLNMSKADFERSFVYDGAEFQYDKVAVDAKALAELETTVEQTSADVDGTMTEVLQWTIPANYAYEYFSECASMKAIVRFTKENKDLKGEVISHDYVFVTLNWTPAPRNVNPTGVLDNATNKIQQYWFASNSNDAGKGYNEIHVNTEVPGEGHDINNFNKYILETFNDGKVQIANIPAVYKDFADAKLTKTFKFVKPNITSLTGVSGTKYTFALNAERTQLLAVVGLVQTPIAEIATKGKFLVKLVDNEVAKDLLNAAGRDELAKNITARVAVETENECGKSLNKVENNEFDVKFLRPITVKAAKMDNFVDGVDVAAKGSEVAVKLAFTDWRNYKFEGQTINYYEYYGVESIAIDTEKATTNVSGKWAALPEGMNVAYTEGTDFNKGDFGKMTYTNNKTEVGNFDIKVNVVVTYAWGTIELPLTFHVDKTVQ